MRGKPGAADRGGAQRPASARRRDRADDRGRAGGPRWRGRVAAGAHVGIGRDLLRPV